MMLTAEEAYNLLANNTVTETRNRIDAAVRYAVERGHNTVTVESPVTVETETSHAIKAYLAKLGFKGIYIEKMTDYTDRTKSFYKITLSWL